MAKQHLIVPLFIPHQGCPYRCVFCNQNEISGEDRVADQKRLEETLQTYLTRQPRGKLPPHREAAFYGGTFTGLPVSRQEFLLSVLQPWVEEGWVQSLRVSTHARFINPECLDRLWKYQVRTVELGVQSMDPAVSRMSGRVGAEKEVPSAAIAIRRKGFRLGLQMMSGLPGDTERSFLETVDQVIAMRPDFVRIYPTLVLRDTPLHDLYQKGHYEPWDLPRTLALLKQAVRKFRDVAIPIIRLGLHPETSMKESLIAGPYHPSLKYQVDCLLALEEMQALLEGREVEDRAVIFRVPFKQISHYTGPLKQNIESLRKQFNLKDVLLRPEPDLSRVLCEIP